MRRVKPEEGGGWKYSLWGSFFSRIPSTPPSDLILRKKPPFLQYSRLGSLKLPGGKPPLPPSSGVAGSVVIPPVAISSSLPTSCQLLCRLLEECRSFSVASHLPLTAARTLLHKLILLNLRGQFARASPPHPPQGSKCPLSPENRKQKHFDGLLRSNIEIYSLQSWHRSSEHTGRWDACRFLLSSALLAVECLKQGSWLRSAWKAFPFGPQFACALGAPAHTHTHAHAH